MNNDIIWKLKYKKDPKITILTSTNILFFTIFYTIGISSTSFSSYGSYGEIILTIIFFPILSLILYWYSPVFKNISLYRTLDLYKDKIVINETKEYPLNQISSSIKSVHKGHRLTSASWRSCIFTDNNQNTIGEFFFAIDTEEKILNTTPESFMQVIDDLKLKKEYNFKNKLEIDYQKFLSDKKHMI